MGFAVAIATILSLIFGAMLLMVSDSVRLKGEIAKYKDGQDRHL